MLTTHGAEVRRLVPLGRERLVVEFESRLAVECKMELVAPAEFVACLAHGIVAEIGCRMSLGKVCRMGCELVGDNAFFYVVSIG